MDINRYKKIAIPKIKSGDITKMVRETIQQERDTRQDQFEKHTEEFEPIIQAQKDMSTAMDKQQNKLINQLQNNQLAITQGLDNFINTTQNAIVYNQELPKLFNEGPQEIDPKETGPTIIKVENAFNKDDKIILNNHNLIKPSELFHTSPQKLDEERQKAAKIAQLIGSKKKNVMKKKDTKSIEDTKSYEMELDILKRYRTSIKDILASFKYIGKGIYTQPKRNAYKITSQGKYGNLTIDIPKLYGQLRLVAYQNKKKVYDKQVDFDTLDLLTKRFNSRKKYSPLSKMVFNDLNNMSEIPIHRTSKKYKKIGSGVVYFTNSDDLLSRLELLGGSILAGNDGVKDEFSQIAHTLNKLGAIDNHQLNDLIKEYII